MNGNMEGTQKQGDVPALRAAEDSARAERSKISPGDVANQTWCSTWKYISVKKNAYNTA